MLTIEDFEKAGYKRSKTEHRGNAGFALHKRIDDENGKKYFINAWVYDWKVYEHCKDRPISFTPDAQFELASGSFVNIEMIVGSQTSIEDIESFYEEFWQKMNCKYYETWE